MVVFAVVKREVVVRVEVTVVEVLVVVGGVNGVVKWFRVVVLVSLVVAGTVDGKMVNVPFHSIYILGCSGDVYTSGKT